LDTLSGLLDNFVQHGFRRLIIINGHGGNDVPGRHVVFEMRQRNRHRADLLLLFATYWHLGAKPAEHDRSLTQTQMGHACEWETSMMLRIAPHLVGGLRHLRPVEFGGGFEPAVRGWTTKDRSEAGHIGYPNLATAEKGELLFQVFTDDVMAFLERVVRWDGKAWDG
jgi:creatinine amidohydrolase